MPLSKWHKFQFNFLYVECLHETVKAWGLNSFHRVLHQVLTYIIIEILLLSGKGNFKNNLTNYF